MCGALLATAKHVTVLVTQEMRRILNCVAV